MIDTITIRKSTSRELSPQVSAELKQARYLVAEYLHDWGLRDPEVVAEESRRIVERAELQLLESTSVNRNLSSIAIELTMAEVEASIATMANSTGLGTQRRIATTNSIVPRMGRVLLEFPDAIRHRDRPPARLLQVLERSVNPIVPHCNRCDMLPQPRTRLWKLLRKGYWRCVRVRVQKFTRTYLQRDK